MSDLTFLCVTENAPHARRFIEGQMADAKMLGARFRLVTDRLDHREPWMPQDTVLARSAGYLESVLDLAVASCPPGYVLRLDDDERATPDMLGWLAPGNYREHDHWAFPRLNLWPDSHHYITNPPLYPDLQTRLSVREKSGGRRGVHDGSPHGTGALAPVAIEHHKFLVRTRRERERLLDRYDRVRPGAGSRYAMFSVPELYEADLEVARAGA